MRADQALLHLSSLAADFKVGIVSDEFVREMLTVIVDNMNIEDKEAVLKKALQSWFIEEEDQQERSV